MVFRAFGGPLEAKSVRSRAGYSIPGPNASSVYRKENVKKNRILNELHKKTLPELGVHTQ